MVGKIGSGVPDFSRIESDLRALSDAAGSKAQPKTGDQSFADMLKDGIKDVNQGVKESDKASMDLASGKSSNLHETMLAASKAELGFNLIVQMRNKALEAYQEVMRMQV